jgi:ribosomal RNA-processing protein 9
VDVVSNAHRGTWLSSVAALYATDLCASGAADGYVRFWQAGLANNKLKELFRAPVTGHVNGLAFGQKGRFAVAAVGQEHRFGRWDRIQGARNGVHLINMEKIASLSGDLSSDEEDSAESEDDFFAEN